MSMTTSVYVMNMCWVFLLANWIVEGRWKEKFSGFRSNVLLQAFLVAAALLVVAMAWSSNKGYGIDYLRRYLPVVVLPIVILTSPPLKRTQMRCLWGTYVLTVLVVSVIGWIRYRIYPELPYRQIVPYVSHIRFALNICFAICVLAGWAMEPKWHCAKGEPSAKGSNRKKIDWVAVLCVILIGWFLYFLLLIQSYTAYIVLFVTAAVLVAVYWQRMRGSALRWVLGGSLIAIAALVVILVGVHVHSYYHIDTVWRAPLAKYTQNGHPYCHAQDGIVENGNYVNNYVCHEELQREWPAVSHVPIDSVLPGGYPLESTLIRYLNNKGFTKDSAGVWQLSPEDIAAVEQGVDNPVYLHHNLKRMVYVMLFEREYKVHTGQVENFTVLQRLELWQAGWQVLRAHPWFGVGTGDVVDELHAQLQRQGSSLAHTNKHTHNQYLSLLLAFGVVGMCVWVFFFVRAIVREQMWQPPLLAALLCIVLISFISEDTLETLAGAVFATFFMCLMVRNKKGA